MIHFGAPYGFNGFHQTTATPQNAAQHTTQAGQAPVPQTAATPVAFAAAVPVYPVAMMPAYMMAQAPGVYAGGPAGQAGYVESGGQGGHVTANPTNAMAGSSGSYGAAGYGAAGYGGMQFGMPMMMSPVLMALGFPVMMAYPGQPGGQAPQDPVDTVAPPADVVDLPPVIDAPPPAPVPPTDGVVIDVVPPAADDADTNLPTLPITQVSADEFAKYRLVEKSKQSESNLEFSLTTKEGDQITLNFNQLDSLDMSRFRGRTLDGERLFDSQYSEASERIVNMDVVGDLSAEEQAAIDSVLESVIGAVQDFFTGDTGAAVQQLKAMDFDTAQLGELSLQMSMTKSAMVSRGYHNGDDRLHDVTSKNADLSQALEFIASEQKRLVDLAKNVLDEPSSARLIKSLLPPLMAEPFAELKQMVNAPVDQAPAPVVDDVAVEEPVVEDDMESHDEMPLGEKDEECCD